MSDIEAEGQEINMHPETSQRLRLLQTVHERWQSLTPLQRSSYETTAIFVGANLVDVLTTYIAVPLAQPGAPGELSPLSKIFTSRDLYLEWGLMRVVSGILISYIADWYSNFLISLGNGSSDAMTDEKIQKIFKIYTLRTANILLTLASASNLTQSLILTLSK